MPSATVAAPGVGVGQRDDEFLAAVARDVIAVAAQAARQRLRDLAQHVVAGRVAVVVVERLEVIDVDEQHGQRAAAARRALGFLREHRIERAAVVEARQRIGVREPVQLRFRVLPALQLARQRERAPRDERRKQAHQHDGPHRAVLPRRIDVDLGGRDVDDQRQPGEMLVNIDAPHAVDGADPAQLAVAAALRVDEQRRVVQVEADHPRVVRQARHERAVVLDDRRAAVPADREAVEQRAEVVDAERADDDPGERAVGPVDPAAQRDRQRAAAQPRRVRPADVEPGDEPVAVHGEIVAVGEIALSRGRCARIDRDIAVRIHHENGAEIGAGGRAVEQQPVALARR